MRMYFKNKKIISLFMALFMLITTLFFVCFILKEHNHECADNDCSICYDISIAKSVVKNKLTYTILTFFMALVFICKNNISCDRNVDSKKDTLITLKVELIN